ncbi:unnamed protein product [Heligmosomoides polygyrus]|uniref:Response regulatory domain-containing protein n=1 Tax=Heligmosomoides polygyrus TaxID=6339 RepID=A0A183G6C1_HELPZ|nr:unnamed protein product [Heligmosomoides polygyrus]
MRNPNSQIRTLAPLSASPPHTHSATQSLPLDTLPAPVLGSLVAAERDEALLLLNLLLNIDFAFLPHSIPSSKPRRNSSGVIVSERSRDSIVTIERFDDPLMKIVVAAKERLTHFSAYAPQTGCSDQARTKDVIIVADDLAERKVL